MDKYIFYSKSRVLKGVVMKKLREFFRNDDVQYDPTMIIMVVLFYIFGAQSILHIYFNNTM